MIKKHLTLYALGMLVIEMIVSRYYRQFQFCNLRAKSVEIIKYGKMFSNEAEACHRQELERWLNFKDADTYFNLHILISYFLCKIMLYVMFALPFVT